MSAGARDVRVAIVGSGFGGLGTAIALRREGIEDFVILERAGDVGGTWRDNTYPGCACDVQSHLYSFSFAPNPDWTHSFSPQAEIQAYLQRCARDADLGARLLLRHEVLGAAWDDAAQRWEIETTRGHFNASVLVMATGPLSEPSIPRLPGLEEFQGRVFHSARWDHEAELAGRSVVVIGTGASAIQFVPEIQPVVGRLHLFQRTAPWILPRPGGAIGPRARWLYRRVPLLQRTVRAAIYAARELMVPFFRHPALMRRAERLARVKLAREVADPVLREKLTPRFTLGCKRVLLSNDYLPAVSRENVEVVCGEVREVRARSVVGSDGVERAADVIIFGTGFTPTEPLLAATVIGHAGASLRDAWGGSPHAFVGTTVAGFPNLFLLLGPNTGLGHSSVVYMIEAQVAHVLAALRFMRRTGITAIEPRAEAQARYVREVDGRMRGTVWVAGGCHSWYLDRTGRNSTLWPDFTWRFRRRATRFRPEDYMFTARAA